jgi:hypothetical protein
MLPMNERVLQSQKMMIVVAIHLLVQQVQDRNFHHRLIEVGCTILDHLDGDDFLGAQVLALNYLPEGTLAENIEDEVAIFVS